MKPFGWITHASLQILDAGIIKKRLRQLSDWRVETFHRPISTIGCSYDIRFAALLLQRIQYPVPHLGERIWMLTGEFFSRQLKPRAYGIGEASYGSGWKPRQPLAQQHRKSRRIILSRFGVQKFLPRPLWIIALFGCEC